MSLFEIFKCFKYQQARNIKKIKEYAFTQSSIGIFKWPQSHSMVVGDGKHFYWEWSFIQAMDRVYHISFMCWRNCYFRQESFKQGIFCGFVEFLLHLYGFYLFCMTTAWLILKDFRFSVKRSTHECFFLYILEQTVRLLPDCTVYPNKYF